MRDNRVIPLSLEILETQKRIDDIEWEGGSVYSLQRYLEFLKAMQDKGEVYYANF